MTRSRRALRVASVVTSVMLVSAVLAGCASTVSMTAAPGSDSPDCAAVTVRLPDAVDGQSRVWTDAQATGAWGSPTTVLLTCGLEPLGPTTLPCQSVGGVDWVMDDTDAPRYRFTTFGRVPAVEVYLDYDVVSGNAVLSALSGAVGMLPASSLECTERPRD